MATTIWKAMLIVLGLCKVRASWFDQRCEADTNTFQAPPPLKGMAVIMFNVTLPMMQFMVDGTNFHTQELRLGPKSIQDYRKEALTYFENKFGINSVEHSKDIAIRLYETNPSAGMRCVVLSGERYIPQGGFVVRDGGWMLTIINSKGLVLGGEFPGVKAEFGTTFTVGHWSIQRLDKSGNKLEPLIWRVQHSSPGGIVATYDGAGTGISRSSHGIMQVFSKDWGVGQSFHVSKYIIDGRGKASAVLRNVITF